MARRSLDRICAEYAQAKQQRAPHETQFRLNAAYCLPREYALWQQQDIPTPLITNNSTAQSAVARVVYDNTGVRCMPKYSAILHRMLTPEGQKYHRLTIDNPNLLKIYRVRQFYDELTNILFSLRNSPRANFKQQQGEVWNALGVYGTGPSSLTWRRPSPSDPRGGFNYKAWPMRDIFIIVDDEGQLVGLLRRFWLNVRMFKYKWPSLPLPRTLAAEANNDPPSETAFAEFIHCVYVRSGDTYDPQALDARRHPWDANYVCVSDKEYVGEEGGFLTNPYFAPRVFTIAGDPYGYSPAEIAFPALGGLSAIKKTVLKQGQKAVDPTVLAHDDGALSGRVDLRPGKVIYGGVDSQGRQMLQPFQTGANFQVAEKLIEGERLDVEDSFLVSLFRILEKGERMTTAEVYEKLSLQSSQIAPSMGRLQSEDQGPKIEREIALVAEHGMLPEVPPELIEAKGEYTVSYQSPLAKAMYAEEVSGFTRLAEMTINVAAQTGDPSAMDHLNWDVAVPEIADKTNVPTRWTNTPEAVAAKREVRQKQMEQEQMVKAAPAMASVAASALKTKQGATVQ